MNNSKHSYNTESGNILIYILGAIFLLGILVYVVKGSNTPGAGIDQETLMIRVSEVQSYGQELERAVTYILQNGHSEVDIRFAHPNADSAYGDITDDPTRQVFSSQGGGATYREPPDGIQTTATVWVFNGENTVNQVGTSGCATSECVDLVAFLPNVTKNFCLKLNETTSVDNPGGNPPIDNVSAEVTSPFIGTYVNTYVVNPLDGSLSGHLEGCFEGGGTPPTGTYHYYRVLLAR